MARNLDAKCRQCRAGYRIASAQALEVCAAFHARVQHVYQGIKRQQAKNQPVILVVSLVQIDGLLIPIRRQQLRGHGHQQRIQHHEPGRPV